MQVRIFKPAKSSMQSGDGNGKWLLEFVKSPHGRFNEELMGRTSCSDMMSEVKISFRDLNEAIAYAKEKDYVIEVIQPKTRKLIKKSYTSNFG